MQTRDLFMTCTTDTLLAHRVLLLGEVKLLDEALVERESEIQSASDAVTPTTKTPIEEPSPPAVPVQTNETLTDQAAIDSALGDEIEFVVAKKLDGIAREL